MPTRQDARKRALAVDNDGARTKTSRSLLSSRQLNVSTLNTVLRQLEREPDVLTANDADMTAAAAGYFESVRRTARLLQTDGTLFD